MPYEFQYIVSLFHVIYLCQDPQYTADATTQSSTQADYGHMPCTRSSRPVPYF